MTTHTVTLTLPDPVYHRYKRAAEQANRPVEAELLHVLTAAAPQGDELPADLAEAIAPLASLDDEGLWQAARSRITPEQHTQMEELHFKRQRGERLSEAETQTLTDLHRQYERCMLVRAHAALLLKQRGHDISVLLTPP